MLHVNATSVVSAVNSLNAVNGSQATFHQGLIISDTFRRNDPGTHSVGISKFPLFSSSLNNFLITKII